MNISPFTKTGTFFWQGILILLPVVILAIIGAFSLRQEKILVENEAKENCSQIAEALASTLSKDLYQQAREMVTDILIASGSASNRETHYSKTAWFPREKIEADIDAPLYNKLVSQYSHRQLLAQSRLLIDSHGYLINGTSGNAIPLSSDPQPHSLDTSILSQDQNTRWQAAQNAETGSLTNAIQSLESFLSLSPPEPFAAQASYTLALFKAKSGNVSAIEDFKKLEGHPDAVTENGVPIRLLAALQRLQLTPHPSPEEVSTLCSNTLALSCFYTPLILRTVENIEAHTLKTQYAKQAMSQWEQQKIQRDFLKLNSDLLTQSTNLQIAWLPWRQERWFAISIPLQGQSNNSQKWVYALNELLLRETVWEIIIRSRTQAPDYAQVKVTLSQTPLLGPTNNEPTLASVSTTWVVDSTKIPGLTVSLILTRPELLHAAQKNHIWFMSVVIFASALASAMGFFNTYRAFREQIRLNELKSNFVSAVSHELRAPIASVRLLAEGLHREKVTGAAKQKEYFQFIVQECRRLSSLIENVLDFSRIEQGRKKYQFEPSDMLALARQTVQLLTPNAQERQVQLRLNETGNPPENPPFTCDGLAIQQALINLIDNALKHSPAGSEVVVGIESDAGEFRLWVEDKGPGIPASEQEKIFERFYRLGSELRRETQGIGIGLSIVKHIMEAHGGHVQVQSEPGHGSRFTLVLKAASVPENTPS